MSSQLPEYLVLQALLRRDFPGSIELRAQMNAARIVKIESEGSPALLFYFDSEVTAAPVVQRVPVEATWGDAEGSRIHCLLHVVDGVLKELEFYREDGAPIPSLPPLDQLHIDVNGVS